MQNPWSVFHLFHQNWHSLSPLHFSAYKVNLDTRILADTASIISMVCTCMCVCVCVCVCVCARMKWVYTHTYKNNHSLTSILRDFSLIPNKILHFRDLRMNSRYSDVNQFWYFISTTNFILLHPSNSHINFNASGLSPYGLSYMYFYQPNFINQFTFNNW